VILAWLMRWKGMHATRDSEESVDHAWNARYRGRYADWDF
jgi:hypothetical protein